MRRREDAPASRPRLVARPHRARARARLLLRADRHRPGLLAADLLLPRPDRTDVIRVLRLGRLEGAAVSAHARRARRPRELRRDPPGRDLRRADAVTGSIWAKASWGVWWSWSENQLVLFLVLFLFYCAYFMLRFSVEPGRPRANMSAVYALFGVVLIPVSFLAIRLSQNFIHPVVFNSHGPQMTGAQFLTFCVSSRGRARRVRDALPRRACGEAHRRAPARAAGAAHMTSSPPSEWQYVAAAYLVVFVTVLLWVAIVAAKLQRLQRQLGELVERARDRG